MKPSKKECDLSRKDRFKKNLKKMKKKYKDLPADKNFLFCELYFSLYLICHPLFENELISLLLSFLNLTATRSNSKTLYRNLSNLSKNIPPTLDLSREPPFLKPPLELNYPAEIICATNPIQSLHLKLFATITTFLSPQLSEINEFFLTFGLNRFFDVNHLFNFLSGKKKIKLNRDS